MNTTALSGAIDVIVVQQVKPPPNYMGHTHHINHYHDILSP